MPILLIGDISAGTYDGKSWRPEPNPKYASAYLKSSDNRVKVVMTSPYVFYTLQVEYAEGG